MSLAELFCGCGHSPSDHNQKGCTMSFTKFNWNGKDFDLQNVPCRCRVKRKETLT